MLNIKNLPIEPPIFRPQTPSIAAVENCCAIPKHFPAKEKPPTPQNTAKNTTYQNTKPVSFPSTLGGNLDLKA